MKRKLLLFIPMYNCEKQIKRVLAKVDSGVREYLTEILVADNGSADGSVDSARLALSGIKGVRTVLIKNKKNYSLGGSLKLAFKYCLDNNFDHCLVLHGDDQADIGDILPYLRDEKFFSYDCAFGSRFDTRSRLRGYSRTRTLGNKALNLLTSLAAGRKVTDLGSGLQLYSAAYLKGGSYLRFPDNLSFEVYLLFHCLWTGAKFVFFPISWTEEDQKSNARSFRQGLEILFLLLKCLVNPKHLSAPGPSAGIEYSYDIIYSREP
ncbi:MAG TPA: glycosyltransferase family 2 protein [Elusimicrobia bacterium]|nr:MAG: hypothetical protein A2016_08965 [Elusimicrobia bacterium GWF2_62_30]HBA61969.1 glycosyltransferase family 2 protein [Elusimicrobiota bacterium]